MSWWQSLGLPGAQIDKAQIKFPVELELVPDILRASISLNSFSLNESALQCWTYASEGLRKLGQKEIILSILKQPEQQIADYPQAPLEFFKTVFQHALRKETIDLGSISEFGDNGFLSSNFTAAAYLRSLPFGDFSPPENSLCMLLLTTEELAAAQIAGLTRVISLLGKTSLHFPCPLWNDINRASVVSADLLASMSESFIAELPRILIRNSAVSAADRVIDLQLPLSARTYFKQISNLEEGSPLLLQTDLDERADALLVFQADRKSSPLAISAPGKKSGRIAGSFICFAPEQEADHGAVIEDGFVITLRQQSWNELKNNLVDGKPFYLCRQDDGYDFRLAWCQDTEQEMGPETIEITGEDLGCSKASNKSNDNSTVPAYATEVMLLTHESEISRLLDPETLKRYIEHIEGVVRDHFFCMGETEGFELSLECTILPLRKAQFFVTSNPIMEADDERDLLDRLSLTYSPEIPEGFVKFKLVLAVWGGI